MALVKGSSAVLDEGVNTPISFLLGIVGWLNLVVSRFNGLEIGMLIIVPDRPAWRRVI
ncbi:MAG: hypothetical protein KGJ76_07845 [Betaproteobacteria bacterium]|nr:hypothetical protein [Betaproteobacteria bacterium]